MDALRAYDLLDTAPEQALDDLTSLAASICDAPISLISLVDEHRQWFKSNRGLPFEGTPRAFSFCGHAILEPGLFVVPDASRDERFADNPMVTGDLHVRFYAGAPLVTVDGHALGTLCVMDRVPREMRSSQLEALRILSRQVMAQFELRRQTRELSESEARLLRVFQSCPVGVAIHRWRDRTFVDVNDAFTALFGLTRDEVLGHTTQEMNIVGEDASAALRARLQEGQVLRDAEVTCRTRRGEILQVLMGSELVELRHEAHTITTFVDISDRKRAEAAAVHLAAIVESSQDAIIGKDMTGRITSWNRGASALFGYSASEMLGSSIMRLIPADRREEETHILDRIRRNENVELFETQRLTKDGHLLDVSVAASPIRDAAGKVIGASKVARDITGRKLADAALHASEERMRFALENADVGIWDIDYRTRVIRWSPTLEHQYGLETATFAGSFEAFERCVHPEDRAAVMASLRDAERSGDDFSMLHRAIWPDESVRWLSGAGRIQLDESGQPVRGVGISMDVTERLGLEEQYRQAQKMEAVGRLAGGVAHDFNNLLTVILGYCELLLFDFAPDDERQTDVAEIQRAGMQASRLTRQLLAFSRKQIIEPTLLDLNQLATEVQSMLGRVIGENVRMRLELGEELGLVKADRSQVEQILMNLAVNARDAMPDGGILTIGTANVQLDDRYVGAHPGMHPGPYVVLTVADTGIGMDADVQARIFEPFFTTKELGKGTGLGMATVYGIATRSGGTVDVDSVPGKGTTFTVYLPKASEVAAKTEIPKSSARPRKQKHTVLVVEDESGLRELARRLLELQGYTVLVAPDALEALRLFEINPSIDVLLTDVVMPGASGPELTAWLTERRPTLKVVYMTGYTEEAIVHRGMLVEGITLLHKPFTSESLGEKIRKVLEQ